MAAIRWIYKPLPDKNIVENLSKAINVSSALAKILVQRKVTTFDAAKSFFRPSLNDLHDPFLMRDMDRAVERLQNAINNNEKIMVYGDYDVDGTTSVALVYSFLKKRYKNLDYYIPDRYKEGYGISRASIDYAKKNNFKLIIALDCGIKSVELVDYANTLGVDFIICDHHRPGDVIPRAIAVLDPKREDCTYPFDELSGCGVGFKLMQGYAMREGILKDEVYDLLDLVVVSIACDIVPIVGENRVLSFYGLEKLNKNPRTGLKKLLEIGGFKLDKQLTIMNVVFGLGPRINAAGRIDHAEEAVKLLISENDEDAGRYSEILQNFNVDRKDLDKSITLEALQMIENSGKINQKSTVLFKDTWHKGVIGIVASRCIESYHRPTIILTKTDQNATGSARSVEGFDVYEAIEECKELLEQFGGHTHAAGLSLKLENLEAFKEKFEQVVSRRIKPDQLIPQIEIDMKIRLKEATERFMKVLNQVSPFGPANMQPVFVSENVYDIGEAKVVGKDNPIHLKLKIRQEDSATYDAIGFSMGHYLERILAKERFHICYNIEENHFLGKTTLQLRLKDLKFANDGELWEQTS